MKVRIKHLFAIVVYLTMALTFSMQNKVFALDAGWQDGDPLSVRFVYNDNLMPDKKPCTTPLLEANRKNLWKVKLPAILLFRILMVQNTLCQALFGKAIIPV